jgi:hypothetical protein
MRVVSNTSPLSNFPEDQVKRLRAEARFFVSPALEKALLISVGET